MTPNEILDATLARMAGNSEIEGLLRARWEGVKTSITEKVDKSGLGVVVPDIAAYDAFYKRLIARIEFLTAFAEGDDLDECERRAYVKAGLE